MFHQVVTHPLAISTGRGFGEALRYLSAYFSPLPYSLAKYCRSEVARHLREVLAAERYDLILCDFLNAAGVVPFDLGIPVVLFTAQCRSTDLAAALGGGDPSGLEVGFPARI